MGMTTFARAYIICTIVLVAGRLLYLMVQRTVRYICGRRARRAAKNHPRSKLAAVRLRSCGGVGGKGITLAGAWLHFGQHGPRDI